MPRAVKQKKTMRFSVLVLFLVSFVIRCVLHFALMNGPSIVIDEGLYTNIARSLAWEGELAFRGQPVDYPYLLYSLTLVPLYWLNRLLGGDMYRYVQFFGTLVITSSVFPAYLFAKDFTQDQKKAKIAAVLVSLMPDMIMGGYEMAECLIWPLTIWMFVFAYRLYRDGGWKNALLTAFFSGLLFFAKPGAVVMGAGLLVFYLFHAFFREKENRKQAVVALLLLLGMAAAVFGLYHLLFPYDKSLMGLYAKQTSEWKSGDLLVALEGVFVMVFLFLFGCGGIGGLLPLMRIKHYDAKKRHFIIGTSLGVLVSIIGTAIFVVPYKWTGALGQIPVHMRYCAMFVPAFMVFFLGMEKPSGKMSKATMTALLLFAVLCVFPGVRIGFVPGETTIADSVLLSAFCKYGFEKPTAAGWVITAIVAGVCLYLVTQHRKGWGDKVQKYGAAFLAFSLLFHTVCAYMGYHSKDDPTLIADVKEVGEMVGDQECLGITQRYYDDVFSYWLDSRLNPPMQQVTIDQMYVKALETDGVYVPFVPEEQAPNAFNHETTDTDKFLLGLYISQHLELNESVKTQVTKNGYFTLAQIIPGERWVDSMMYGLDRCWLYPEEKGYITVLDENRIRDGKVTLHIRAAGGGTLMIDDTEIPVQLEMTEYTVSVPYQRYIPMTAQGDQVYIESYRTEIFE